MNRDCCSTRREGRAPHRGPRRPTVTLLLPLLLLPLLLLPGGLAPAATGGDGDPELMLLGPGTGPSYHLRIVRVSGAAASPGAAIGCKDVCGTPIVAPDDEAWGTPNQLAALARALGGERAEAVTGYIVRSSMDGSARFEATVYPGEVPVDLRFAAQRPDDPGAAHEMVLRVLRHGVDGVPLAEARILSASERTVAIAAPSPAAGEWVVVAVTPLDPAAVLARIQRYDNVRVPGDEAGQVLAPRLVEMVHPQYPERARNEKRMGRIVLQAVIDTEGIPRAISVVRLPEGCEDLAATAVEAVQRWRYEPATLDGKPVPVIFTVVIAFRLE